MWRVRSRKSLQDRKGERLEFTRSTYAQGFGLSCAPPRRTFDRGTRGILPTFIDAVRTGAAPEYLGCHDGKRVDHRPRAHDPDRRAPLADQSPEGPQTSSGQEGQTALKRRSRQNAASANAPAAIIAPRRKAPRVQAHSLSGRVRFPCRTRRRAFRYAGGGPSRNISVTGHERRALNFGIRVLVVQNGPSAAGQGEAPGWGA